MITLNKVCGFCGVNHELQVNKQDLSRFENGEHIQTVMPYLSADERELFVSGICGSCFDSMFADEEDDAE